MRREYRHPVAAIVMMALTFGVIAVIQAQVGALRLFGFSLFVMCALAVGLGVMVWAILFARHRAGVHRLSDVRTWTPQR